MAGIDNPMKFEELRDSIEALLTANQTGRFQTVGQQVQRRASEEADGILRIVEIFYSDGEYPENRSSKQESQHDIVFQIYYTVSEPSTADLDAIKNGTPSEIATALLNQTSGSRSANLSIDALHRMVSQIILDPVNNQLGMPGVGTGGRGNQVANVRLKNFRKDAPLDAGNLITLTASAQLIATVQETFTGATPVAPAEHPIDINNDNQPISGDEVTPPSVGTETTS